MGRWKKRVRGLTKVPGVPQARHVAERSVAPYLRSDLHLLGVDHAQTVVRLSELELKVEQMMRSLPAASDGASSTAERLNELDAKVEQMFGSVAESSQAVSALEVHQPAILNAIASTNGTTRLLARESNALRDLISANESAIGTVVSRMERDAARLDGVDVSLSRTVEIYGELSRQLTVGDEAVREDFRPHIRTLAWLLERVETVRAEMMHELRYGKSTEVIEIEAKIVNPEHLKDVDVRLNLGAGHIALEGFVNVDMRELPGIDVVAPVDSLPFEPGTIAEIFSSHTVEHFPELQLRRKLLPYWSSLLRAGGTFRAIVPDLEAMTKAYARGKMSFETLRAVTYGGQEYEGDFHFNGFTPKSLGDLLVECGFEKPKVIAKGRPNGDCLEFEISAVKPSG